MASLSGKTLFVTGASRGIGKAIAVRAARDGANVVIAAKTAEPHPQLPGTIYSAAEDVEAAGGRALPIQMDVRFEDQIAAAVQQAVERFGGIDILVNNASAISLTGTGDTPLRRWDLMMDINARGTFACCQACLPYLKQAANPHILMLAPPINLNPKWFKRHTAYTVAKYCMSLYVLGLSAELSAAGIAVNALWPRTVIGTAALVMLGELVKAERCRTPEIVADAAHAILVRNSRSTTGNFFIDEDVLSEAGVTDFSPYAIQIGAELLGDLFLD
jgi:citronellol/citronellal dehydrogenase